jgi:predicted  nucleic acid-binding Zn-ribbon protein
LEERDAALSEAEDAIMAADRMSAELASLRRELSASSQSSLDLQSQLDALSAECTKSVTAARDASSQSASQLAEVQAALQRLQADYARNMVELSQLRAREQTPKSSQGIQSVPLRTFSRAVQVTDEQAAAAIARVSELESELSSLRADSAEALLATVTDSRAETHLRALPLLAVEVPADCRVKKAATDDPSGLLSVTVSYNPDRVADYSFCYCLVRHGRRQIKGWVTLSQLKALPSGVLQSAIPPSQQALLRDALAAEEAATAAESAAVLQAQQAADRSARAAADAKTQAMEVARLENSLAEAEAAAAASRAQADEQLAAAVAHCSKIESDFASYRVRATFALSEARKSADAAVASAAARATAALADENHNSPPSPASASASATATASASAPEQPLASVSVSVTDLMSQLEAATDALLVARAEASGRAREAVAASAAADQARLEAASERAARLRAETAATAAEEQLRDVAGRTAVAQKRTVALESELECLRAASLLSSTGGASRTVMATPFSDADAGRSGSPDRLAAARAEAGDLDGHSQPVTTNEVSLVALETELHATRQELRAAKAGYVDGRADQEYLRAIVLAYTTGPTDARPALVPVMSELLSLSGDEQHALREAAVRGTRKMPFSLNMFGAKS